VIFGRKKANANEDSVHVNDEVVDEVAEDLEELDEDEELEEPDEWEEFDLGQDWRADGPFDIDEVDLSADEVDRMDLGAMILTPEKGMTIKLIANPAQQILHALVEDGSGSAVQITVFAAPSAGNYCATIRNEIIAGTQNAKVIEKAKGPFGTEIRRVVVATDEKGREGFAPLRDWLVSGPRWVLNARLIGKAAVESNGRAAKEFEEFVRNIIVRRGEVAMVPGAVVPLTPGEQK